MVKPQEVEKGVEGGKYEETKASQWPDGPTARRDTHGAKTGLNFFPTSPVGAHELELLLN